MCRPPSRSRSRAELGRHGRGEDAGVGVGDEHGLCGGVDAAACLVVPQRDRLERVERLFLAVLLERPADMLVVLGVDPADDLGHRAAAAGGGEEDRREELGGGCRTRTRRRRSMPPPGRASTDEPFRDALGALPGEALRRAASSRRSGGRCCRWGRRRDVLAPGIAERAASVSRRRSVLTEVATTGPCHSRIAGIANPVVLPVCVGPTTITDCRGSAATRRSVGAAEGQAARLVAAHEERAKVAGTRPVRCSGRAGRRGSARAS